MALDISRIKAICFDVDGTLSDTDDLWVDRFSKKLKPFSFCFSNHDPIPFTRWAIMATESPANLMYHLLDRFDLDDDVARFYNFLSRHRVGRKPSHYWLVPGVQEMLHQIQAHYPMSVVSARDNSTFDFLSQFELTDLFKTVVTMETCRFTKPYPQPVIWAAQQMNVTPQECLMVGDTTVDIKAGRAAGAQTVGVLCGFGKEKELRRAGADLILSSTADLWDILSVKAAG